MEYKRYSKDSSGIPSLVIKEPLQQIGPTKSEGTVIIQDDYNLGEDLENAGIPPAWIEAGKDALDNITNPQQRKNLQCKISKAISLISYDEDSDQDDRRFIKQKRSDYIRSLSETNINIQKIPRQVWFKPKVRTYYESIRGRASYGNREYAQRHWYFENIPEPQLKALTIKQKSKRGQFFVHSKLNDEEDNALYLSVNKGIDEYGAKEAEYLERTMEHPLTATDNDPFIHLKLDFQASGAANRVCFQPTSQLVTFGTLVDIVMYASQSGIDKLSIVPDVELNAEPMSLKMLPISGKKFVSLFPDCKYYIGDVFFETLEEVLEEAEEGTFVFHRIQAPAFHELCDPGGYPIDRIYLSVKTQDRLKSFKLYADGLNYLAIETNDSKFKTVDELIMFYSTGSSLPGSHQYLRENLMDTNKHEWQKYATLYQQDMEEVHVRRTDRFGVFDIFSKGINPGLYLFNLNSVTGIMELCLTTINSIATIPLYRTSGNIHILVPAYAKIRFERLRELANHHKICSLSHLCFWNYNLVENINTFAKYDEREHFKFPWLGGLRSQDHKIRNHLALKPQGTFGVYKALSHVFEHSYYLMICVNNKIYEIPIQLSMKDRIYHVFLCCHGLRDVVKRSLPELIEYWQCQGLLRFSVNDAISPLFTNFFNARYQRARCYDFFLDGKRSTFPDTLTGYLKESVYYTFDMFYSYRIPESDDEDLKESLKLAERTATESYKQSPHHKPIHLSQEEMQKHANEALRGKNFEMSSTENTVYDLKVIPNRGQIQDCIYKHLPLSLNSPLLYESFTYVGEMSLAMAQHLLKDYQKGSFLIRHDTKDEFGQGALGSFHLTVSCGGAKVLNYQVRITDGEAIYLHGETHRFHSVDALLRNYRYKSLPQQNDDVRLGIHVTRQIYMKFTHELRAVIKALPIGQFSLNHVTTKLNDRALGTYMFWCGVASCSDAAQHIYLSVKTLRGVVHLGVLCDFYSGAFYLSNSEPGHTLKFNNLHRLIIHYEQIPLSLETSLNICLGRGLYSGSEKITWETENGLVLSRFSWSIGFKTTEQMQQVFQYCPPGTFCLYQLEEEGRMAQGIRNMKGRALNTATITPYEVALFTDKIYRFKILTMYLDGIPVFFMCEDLQFPITIGIRAFRSIPSMITFWRSTGLLLYPMEDMSRMQMNKVIETGHEQQPEKKVKGMQFIVDDNVFLLDVYDFERRSAVRCKYPFRDERPETYRRIDENILTNLREFRGQL